MKSKELKELQLVQVLSEEEGLTQRDIFLRLDMAQGLVNRYLKQLARKGWIKLSTSPPKRMLYWLTPKGMAEKTRLTYEFVTFTYRLFREAHRETSNTLRRLARKSKVRRIVLYGAESVAEIASMSLKENEIELVAVADEDAKGCHFLGKKVIGIDDLDGLRFDAILFAKHSRRDDAILLRLLATKGRTINLFEQTDTRATGSAAVPAKEVGR